MIRNWPLDKCCQSTIFCKVSFIHAMDGVDTKQATALASTCFRQQTLTLRLSVWVKLAHVQPHKTCWDAPIQSRLEKESMQRKSSASFPPCVEGFQPRNSNVWPRRSLRSSWTRQSQRTLEVTYCSIQTQTEVVCCMPLTKAKCDSLLLP